MADVTISDTQLVTLIRSVVLDALASAGAVGAASATSSQSEATTGAGARRTVSNDEQADNVDSALSLLQKQVDSDIDTPEAWKANVKRTYDIHQSEDLENARRNRVHFDNLVSTQLTHLANVNQLTVQALANNQNNANVANAQSIAHRDIAIDRQWNVNATDLAEKSAAALTDLVLAKVAQKA